MVWHARRLCRKSRWRTSAARALPAGSTDVHSRASTAQRFRRSKNARAAWSNRLSMPAARRRPRR